MAVTIHVPVEVSAVDEVTNEPVVCEKGRTVENEPKVTEETEEQPFLIAIEAWETFEPTLFDQESGSCTDIPSIEIEKPDPFTDLRILADLLSEEVGATRRTSTDEDLAKVLELGSDVSVVTHLAKGRTDEALDAFLLRMDGIAACVDRLERRILAPTGDQRENNDTETRAQAVALALESETNQLEAEAARFEADADEYIRAFDASVAATSRRIDEVVTRWRENDVFAQICRINT